MPNLMKALITDRIPIYDHGNFCWHNCFFLPHESLWSILHKFAWLNCCSSVEMNRFFGINKSNFAQNSTNKIGQFNNNLLNYINLTGTDKDNSTTELYLFGREEKVLTVDHLRYCSGCIEYGFHSPIHQLPFIDRCPYHESKIENCCLKCGNKNSLKISPAVFDKPYSCSHCGASFFPNIEQFLYFRYSNHYRSSVQICFGEVSKKLVQRKYTYGSFAEDIFNVKSRVRKKITLTYVFSINTLLKHLVNGGNCHEYTINEYEINTTFTEIQDLFASYRSIRRMIKKTLLGKHCKCLKFVTKIDSTFSNNYEDDISSLCKTALAFVLWRMYMEDAFRPNDLDTKRRPKKIHSMLLDIMQPSIVDGLFSKKYFMALCLIKFKQCLSEAAEMIHKGSLDFYHYKNHLTPGPLLSIPPKIDSNRQVIKIYTQKQEGIVEAYSQEHYRENKKICTKIDRMVNDFLHETYSEFHPRR